ncbi:MAG: epoxyqueuosine reductase QueH, partial [Ruminococcus sp.]|nr:epoxyqueuosine reductase QueH [Ruminococcus sp.]
TISPHKDSEFINSAGKEISEKYGVPYLFSDFKKKNGYKRSIQLSAEYNLYRQSFCGWIYSKIQSQQKGCDV